jgi:uncharacterized protein (DUF1330 family)
MGNSTQAFAVGQVTIKNQDFWLAYKLALTKTLINYEGSVVFRGKVNDVLAGVKSHTDVVLIAFSSIGALTAWFNSAEYQAIIPLRDSAAEVTLTSYAP